MGVTFVAGRIAPPGRKRPRRSVRFLVDSGATYSVVPARLLRALRIRPERTVRFALADGTEVERELGEATFELAGARATSPVVFETEGTEALLGAVTLETLGLMLDPFSRRLLPMRVFAHLLRGI